MKQMLSCGRVHVVLWVMLAASVCGVARCDAGAPRSPGTAARAQPAEREPRLTLQRLVQPATRVVIGGRVIRFSLHGLIGFDTLQALFAHIDAEAGRWRFDTAEARQAFADGLLARGVESRLVSMETELPLELLLAHTEQDIARAMEGLVTARTPLVFEGRFWRVSLEVYRDAFVRVKTRWSKSLNCWSAASSIPARVLSNWYLIDEGIELFGATYDSTEHFWQAVKYHPSVTVGQLTSLLATLVATDWQPWLRTLEGDQSFYFANAYAVEFLKHNLTPQRLQWFHDELTRVAGAGERPREAQQRAPSGAGTPVRFTALQEKVLWGDIADVLHLITAFSARADAPPPAAVSAVRTLLVAHHFDAIYLPGHGAGTFPFLGRDFQELMFVIWKVKFLDTARFREVIRSTAGRRLDHFLDDGSSPDIPIPIYVNYLNHLRDLAVRDVSPAR